MVIAMWTKPVLRRIELDDYRWVGPDTMIIHLAVTPKVGRLVYVHLAGEDSYGIHIVEESRRMFLSNWCAA